MATVVRADGLCEPDQFGNYWLGKCGSAPAILCSSIDRRFLVLLDKDYGFARTTTPEGVLVIKVTDPRKALDMLHTWQRSRSRPERLRIRKP